MAHPFSRALALSYLATQHALRGEHALTLDYARQAHEVAEQYHVGYYLAWAGMLLAWANAKQSPGANAVAAMRAAIEGFHATGARLRLPLYLGMLAECLGDVGRDRGCVGGSGPGVRMREAALASTGWMPSCTVCAVDCCCAARQPCRSRVIVDQGDRDRHSPARAPA
ncbi:hypothetical protein ACTMU2_05020 [Cupriavidus basilensis]